MRYRDIIAPEATSTDINQRDSKFSLLLAERMPTKPTPPQTAAKSRREQARKARLAAQAQNAREVCARKVLVAQKQMFENGDQP